MLNAVVQAAREAGSILLSAHDLRNAVSEKEGVGNFVTTYDVKVQNFLREKLLTRYLRVTSSARRTPYTTTRCTALPSSSIPSTCTANFVRGWKHSAVSIALAQDGELILGVVYNPYRDEMFTAQKGRGALLDGQPIHVSARTMDRGVFCFGTSPYDRALRARSFRIASRLMDRMQDLRRFGSAALDLTDIACGRAELGFECILQPWDYAAGALILQEAGGRISQLDGSPITLDRPCSILSGNPLVHAAFLALELGR